MLLVAEMHIQHELGPRRVIILLTIPHRVAEIIEHIMVQVSHPVLTELQV